MNIYLIYHLSSYERTATAYKATLHTCRVLVVSVVVTGSNLIALRYIPHVTSSSAMSINHCQVSPRLALSSHYFLAAIFACASLTVDFNSEMTCSGCSAPKIAVPATITLLPDCVKEFQKEVIRFWGLAVHDYQRTGVCCGAPASAQTPIVLGPTPPSTSMSLSGNRARNSATLGTQRSINFWPPLPTKTNRENHSNVSKNTLV